MLCVCAQTEPPSQQHVQIQRELWRIQDVMEALAKNKKSSDTGDLTCSHTHTHTHWGLSQDYVSNILSVWTGVLVSSLDNNEVSSTLSLSLCVCPPLSER